MNLEKQQGERQVDAVVVRVDNKDRETPYKHTVEDDFEHFLCYTNQINIDGDLKKKLFAAFEAAW